MTEPMNTLGYGSPHVGARDMGLWKPEKFFYWCPWPIWYSTKGTAFYVSKRLYATKEAAQTALDKYLATMEAEQASR